MIETWVLLVVSLAYVSLLFLIAYGGDRKALNPERPAGHPVIYSLSLAVYCTSWTFFGAVGTAAGDVWGYLPIYLGPALLLIFGGGLLQRIIRISKQQNLTSIADFVAARYGKSRRLAVLVTVIAVVGIVPYIALQLKAITTGHQVVTGTGIQPGSSFRGDTALYVALFLALFAILFGTRRADAGEHHRGMIMAIAFESVVKLLAFVAVGLFAVYGVFSGPADIVTAMRSDPDLAGAFASTPFTYSFATQTLLAAAAMFCLPRQFHVAVVEYGHASELRMARWLFPLYLAIICLFVVPVSMAGNTSLGEVAVKADFYMLALPIAYDQRTLAVLSFLGGFSAATGMVIVASVALSAMVSNEIVMPLLFRSRRLQLSQRSDVSGVLLGVRRAVIVLLALVSYLYFRITDETAALASIGLLSFAAAVQFAPAVLLGLYWRGATRQGAIAGLLLGFLVWCYTLFIPALTRLGDTTVTLFADGLLNIPWLRPEALFGSFGADPLSHGVLWSLSANVSALVLVSLLTRQTVAEKIQARAFSPVSVRRGLAERWQQHARVSDLQSLAGRFVGEGLSAQSFKRFAREHSLTLEQGSHASPALVQFTERLLAGSIGAASARIVITSALRRKGMEIDDVLTLLDETSVALRFNRQVMEATLDNISQGISVVDAEMRLVGWNRRYAELLGYPENFLTAGTPVSEMIRYNAERGLCGPGTIDEHVEKRLAFMRSGESYTYERLRPNGTVLEMRGNPMPGGGYVTTITDITEFKETERALRDSEQQIRVYTDNAPFLISFVDLDGRYRFANKAYCEFVGLELKDILGVRVEDILTAVQVEERSRYMARALAGERQHFELELESRSGRKQYALGTYVPELDDDGAVLGFYSILQDISIRRRTELALEEAKHNLERRVDDRTRELTRAMEALALAKADAEQANLTKTRFLAAASHDLLQPLNAARLFTSVLKDEAGLAASSEELVQRIDTSLSAAEDLLGALLDISRLDSGAMQPQCTSFSAGDLLSVLEKQFAPLARERNLRLQVVPSKRVVYSDRQLLRRILQNFIVNGLRYTQRGGLVLGCRQDQAGVRLEVWDTGPGIEDENLEVIFEEFRRLDRASTSGARGLGLGLAIVERIAGMLDYPVQVRSRPGSGSVFSVTVPVGVIEPAAGKNRSATRGAAARLEGACVLCVDNEPAVLEGMLALLGQWHCEVLGTCDLASARKQVASRGAMPDIMLVDYHLDDDREGVSLMNALRTEYNCAIPGVIITADRSEAVREHAMEHGYHLLPKPVKPASLRALMANLLRSRRVA